MRIVLSLLMLFLLSACGGGGSSGASVKVPTPDPETWTIFVYGHGDHNLTPSLAIDMQEMAAAKIGSHVSVIVLADWNASTATTLTGQGIPGVGVGNFPSGAHWYKINGVDAVNPIEYLGLYDSGSTENLDDPNVLADAVASAFITYPAQHNAVIMWNHGGGWNGGYGGDWENATTPQGSTGLLAPAIATQIYNGLTAAGISTKLEFLGFDTCLMGSAEVIADISGICKGYLACAEIDFGDGWDYEATLTYISNKSYQDYTHIITAEVNHWNAHHAGQGQADQVLRAHAAWDLSQWDNFIQTYLAFVTELSTNGAVTAVDIARGMYLNTPGYHVQTEVAGIGDPAKDLGTFFKNLSNDTTAPALVASKAQAVYDAADLMMLNRSMGTGRSNLSQRGFSLELPLVSTQWDATRSADYRSKAATWLNYQATDWADILDALKLSADNVGPVINGNIINNANPSAVAQPTVTFDSNDSDVVEARVSLELEVSGGVYFRAGLIAQGIVDNVNSYQYAWDGDLYEIDNGTGQSIGALDPWIPGLFYSIKGKINDGIGTYAAWLLVNEADGNIPTVVYTVDGVRYNAFPVWAFPSNYTFLPEWNYSNATTVDGTAITFPGFTGSLDLVPSAAPAANYRIGIEMIDVWGNSSKSTGDVTVITPYGNG